MRTCNAGLEHEAGGGSEVGSSKPAFLNPGGVERMLDTGTKWSPCSLIYRGFQRCENPELRKGAGGGVGARVAPKSLARRPLPPPPSRKARGRVFPVPALS
jgi:hypothetical protein